MKSKISTFILLFLISTIGFGQDFKDKKEKIKALKIAYISQQLSLSSDQAEKFWPIYNKYEDKIAALKGDLMKQRFQKKEATNEEALKQIEDSEAIQMEIMSLKKKMRSELIPVIGADKVVELQKIEHDFHKKLLEKLKDRKGPPRR